MKYSANSALVSEKEGRQPSDEAAVSEKGKDR